jgi:hypothetical protein
MKTNTPCPRCGKTNPADVHTCTSKKDIEEWFKKQDQSTDSNPIGYLLWDAGIGWWEFVEEKPVEYYDYKAVYAQTVKSKPMDGDQVLEGFRAIGAMGESFILRYFLEGVRYAEKHHGVGEE